MLDIASYLVEKYSGMPSILQKVNLLQEPPAVRGHGKKIGLMEAAVDIRLMDFCDAEIHSRCFCDEPVESEWLLSHGTCSVSLLVAQGRVSMYGLVPRTQLLIASLSNAEGNIDPNLAAKSVEWFLEAGVDIIAIPLGDCIDQEPLAEAIADAIQKGVIIFAASGNIYPYPVTFPARLPGVIAVGAGDFQGNLRLDCCQSPGLDCIMPGTDIPALFKGGEVQICNGSSVACVIAAGLSALESRSCKGRFCSRAEPP